VKVTGAGEDWKKIDVYFFKSNFFYLFLKFDCAKIGQFSLHFSHFVYFYNFLHWSCLKFVQHCQKFEMDI